MIILVSSELSAKRVMTSITCFIERRLKLKVNQNKSQICRPYKLNYLGHTLLMDGSLGLSPKSEVRLKDKIRSITRRNRGISLEQMISELNLSLRGWVIYFRYAKMTRKLQKIESWLHRKIRCFRLKQCKRAKGIIRFLTGLGVPKTRSIIIAGSHKGWYRKSASPQAHEGMNNEWFKKIGLHSLTAIYRYYFKETALYESTQGGVRGR
jgi:RNA-directed DNA polymerase